MILLQKFRLLDREFIPKTEHLIGNAIFGPQNYVITTDLTTLMSLLLFLFCRPPTIIFYRLLV